MERQNHIDLIKCVMIVLMVAFHLQYIEHLYPTAKQVVFTFHMPVFLLISGFFTSVRKSGSDFLHRLGRIALPYVLAEAAYVVASAYMPVAGGVERLSVGVVLDKVFLHPLGPYWYLHTLAVATTVSWLVARLRRLTEGAQVVLTAGLLLALSAWGGWLSLTGAVYFSIGLALRQWGVGLFAVDRATLWSLLPVVGLCLFSENRNALTLGGLGVSLLVGNFLTALCQHLPQRALRGPLWLGRNTLPILLFSPVFTMAVKPLARWLEPVDATGLLFLLFALVVALGGSVAMAWVADRLGLSRRLFLGNLLSR